jgi:hypothetical protein
MAYLEEVFRLSGVPTVTFVHPERYDEIKVSVRTPGRCLVVEGPSGIGKTTTITRVLSELGIAEKVTSLSARRPADVEMIDALPELGDIGTVIVDDFHRLGDVTKAKLSDFMKVLADTESKTSKLILIGINKAGHQLVKFAHDLGLRIDVFRLEANPTELLERVITLGEDALNVSIPARADIAERAQGSFQLVQLLCHKLCVLDGVTETRDDRKASRPRLTSRWRMLSSICLVSSKMQLSPSLAVLAFGRKDAHLTCTYFVGCLKARNGHWICRTQ